MAIHDRPRDDFKNADEVFRQALKKTFLYRAQAVFLGRTALYGLYFTLWVIASLSTTSIFPCGRLDIALVFIGFLSGLLCYRFRSYTPQGRCLHFITLAIDLGLHLHFTRTSGYLFSPLMAIHPFLSGAFLLLFHHPLLLLAPLAMLPMATALLLITDSSLDFSRLVAALTMYCALDAMVIFFIHLTHSKEHHLLRSIVAMEEMLKEYAIIKERQRIAREFHDGVGAKLTSIVLQCDYLHMTNTVSHDFKMEVCEIKESAIEAIEDMRRSIAFLNGEFDISEQIELMMQNLRERHHLSVGLVGVDALTSLPLEQQISCARIIQEGVTNILKHSKASKIDLEVTRYPKYLKLSLTDNGIGFDASIDRKHHHGTKNMQERAKHLSGQAHFSTSIHGGCTFSLEIPTT